MYRFLALLFLLAGCRAIDLTLELPATSPKLVLWGKLEAGKSFRIQLSRSFPVGKIPADLEVKDGTIEILRNGIPYTTLKTSTQAGLYVSDSLIREGDTYIVVATAPGLEEATSKNIRIPSNTEIPKISYELKRGVTGIVNPTVPQDLLSLYFGKGSEAKETFYLLSFLFYYRSGINYAQVWPAYDNVVANEEGCLIRTINGEGKNRAFTYILSSRCLPAEGIPLKFFLQTGNGIIDPDKKLVYEQPWKIEMGIGTVSKDWFEYATIESKQPEGLDYLVLPPQAAYTNIINGYGMLFASNETIIELE
jgi:hypothetical protein